MGESKLRAALLVAGAGAVAVLVNLLGLAGDLAGLGAMAVALVLTRHAGRRGFGEVDWWRMLAAGTALVAVGVPLSLGLETIGGLLAAVGAGIAVVAVALALP